MIKKLFIALIALSFLVGNVAFAEQGDYSTQVGESQWSKDPAPSISLKPAAVDCGFQDYSCSWGPYISTFGYGAYALDLMQRFSSTTDEGCYVSDIGFIIYAATGDVLVKVWAEDPAYDDYPDDYNADGGVLWSGVIPLAELALYPNIDYVSLTSAGFPAGGVTFDAGEDVFISIEPATDPNTITLLLEDKLDPDGSCLVKAEWRSLALWSDGAGGWDPEHGFIVYSGGPPIDFRNAMIFAEICCEEPVFTCTGNQEWPTLQQNDARTGYTENTFGDISNLRRLWDFQGDNYCVFGHPIIVDEKVYVAFYDEIICLDLYTGLIVWQTGNAGVGFHPDYVGILDVGGNAMRTVPTVVDGKIYFGTGGASYDEGLVCADATNGNIIWVRHPGAGTGLPGSLYGLGVGTTQYATPLILGDNVFFGTSFGVFYALNATTGADVWNIELDNGVWFSPSTDGISLYVGTSDGYYYTAPVTGGSVYKLDPADGSTLALFTGDDALAEGFVATPVYSADDNSIVLHSITAEFSDDDYCGLVTKLDATDLTTMWGAPVSTQGNWFSIPNVMPNPWNNITIGGAHTGGTIFYARDDTHRLIGIKQLSAGGNVNWLGTNFIAPYPPYGDFWDRISNGFVSTCDPYLFFGTTLGNNFYAADGESGAIVLKYQLTDYTMGVAAAEYDDHDYVVHTTYASDYGNGAGKVFCYDVGPDRPRLYVPEELVYLDASVSFIDAYPANRTADLFQNIGTAGMAYALEIVTAKSGSLLNAGVSKNVDRIKAEMLFEREALLANNELNLNTPKQSADNLSLAAEFVRFTGGTTTTTGTLGAASTHTQGFELDPDLMLRGANPFEVTIDADDPDYLEVDATGFPHVDPLETVTVVSVKGYTVCNEAIDFGTTGTATHSNHGYVNDGTPGFSLDDAAFYHYAHTLFYGYEDQHVVWNQACGDYPVNHFEANSVCDLTTFTEDIYDAAGLNRTVTGDIFAASFIDSLKDNYTGVFDAANTPGCEMFVKYYGVEDAEFGNFTYTYFEIANRGSDPLPADLYWGTVADLDVGNSGNNVNVGMVGDGLSSYRTYDVGAPNLQFGVGTVPMAGNLYKSTGLPTMGAYGTYAIANDPLIYDCIFVDSIFDKMVNVPAYTDVYYPGTDPGVNTGMDMSGMIIGGKEFVDGDATINGGIVYFGFDNSTAPAADVAAVMNLANKFAGFGRGDVNNDNVINILDLCVLNCFVSDCGCSIYPFQYLGDVDVDGDIDADDVTYLFNYLFMGGPLPMGEFIVR